MKVQTTLLIDEALDWAIASTQRQAQTKKGVDNTQTWPHYSANPAAGRAILLRERISTWQVPGAEPGSYVWRGREFMPPASREAIEATGPDALTAGLRTYALRELGPVVNVPEPFIAPAVGRLFRKGLVDELGEPVYNQICEQNLVEGSPNVCHSHDYLDANMTMAAAIGKLTGHSAEELDIQDEQMHSLWNTAWDLAIQDMRDEVAQRHIDASAQDRPS